VRIRALVTITRGGGIAELAEDDDAGRAPVNAQGATGADIVVDREDDVIVGVFARLFGTDGRR